MAKKIIFQESFLVAGIMCAQTCGKNIYESLSDLKDLKKGGLLPQNAEISVDPDPRTQSRHRLLITIESEQDDTHEFKINTPLLSKEYKEIIRNAGDFEVVESEQPPSRISHKKNWINLAINLFALASIITFSIIFPPSLFLTIGLTSLSFLATAFTARHYLLDFFHNLRNKRANAMTTPIALGWLLSLAHTLHHVITMPLAKGFSMIFMNFMMPIALISIINLLDEIKRIVASQSKKMQIKSLRHLLPQMANEYEGYTLSLDEQTHFEQQIKFHKENQHDSNTIDPSIQQQFDNTKLTYLSKSLLKKGMVIKIKHGECFPVDGIIINQNTLVDASILTGEPLQPKRILDTVPGGSINLGQDTLIYVTADCYHSTTNQLLFRANRADEKKPPSPSQKFNYLYTGLVIAGFLTAIFAPLALGIFTIPLLLQNLTGILFAICPCTIAIAHQLPKLLSFYRRNSKGIIIHNETSLDTLDNIHTIVFDKTGTLTTGQSQVDTSEGISPALWQRIYLLEKKHGMEHPIAKAINHYYEADILKGKVKDTTKNSEDIVKVSTDLNHRGLSGRVHGKFLQIGNAQFLKGISLPNFSPTIQEKIQKGRTPIFIAEDGKYQGVILIKHKVRKNVLAALKKFTQSKKKLILLTGDSKQAAFGFNRQIGSIFANENIHAEFTPQKKEKYFKDYIKAYKSTRGVWFIGDGLNDAPCARIVSEKGGVSCAMTDKDKSAYFTDLSLDGTLDYLFEHTKLNRFVKKNILQNQWLLAYNLVLFLAFMVTFSLTGIAVSPLIPLIIMSATTLLTLFNSYRVGLVIDQALAKTKSTIKQLLVSDISLGLVMGAYSLCCGSILLSTLMIGKFALPTIAFSGAALAVASSACLLTAGAMMGLFLIMGLTYFVLTRCVNPKSEDLEADLTVSEQHHEKQVGTQTHWDLKFPPLRKQIIHPIILSEEEDKLEEMMTTRL